MRAVAAHFIADLRMLARMPGYTVPTLVLPSLFLLLFGGQGGRSPGGPTAPVLLAASFATFAVFGVVFYKFGISIAVERTAPWARYVRILPVPPGTVLVARSLSALVVALAAASTVLATAWLALGAEPSLRQVMRIGAGVLAGAVPFSFFGIALGYQTGPRTSVAVANLCYLVLSYCGGLWVPPDALPPAVRVVAGILPTFHWGRVVWSGALDLPWRAVDWVVLGGWTIVFGAAALYGYLRDEGTRYR